METIICKICQCDVPVENYSLRLNNGKLTRYGKTCDDCRKKKNKEKQSTEEFKLQHRARMRRYNYKRFFYKRAQAIISTAIIKHEPIDYQPLELAKLLASLWRKQNGECALTGDKLDRLNADVDHIITRKNSGPNVIHNFRWITREANRLKGGLNDDELLQLINKIKNKIS